jgi:TolB-like protein/Tfp pilus assembly protein PilF
VNPRNFFAELKRRNVYKVAVAYAVVGWLLVQVATQVFPFFEIPNWAVRLVVLLIIAGFPIALIIAWAFEMTPEGVKRTDRAAAAPQRSRGGAWIYVVIVGVALSIGLFFLGRYTSRNGNTAVTNVSEKSIAVLPFENLSEDKANAYFASGIEDEILTKLAAIGDLKVISRTSTEKYRSHPSDLKTIANELGVAHVLEGSVQKSGDAAHINVQLIDTRTDNHLWAQSYNRELKNIFAVEAEVAEQVATVLKSKLLNVAQVRSEPPPTLDTEAYDLYLRALYAQGEWFRGTGNPDEPIKLLRAAVARDPQFVKAYALLSLCETTKFFQGFNITPELKDDARANAEKAMVLQPELADSLAAMSLIYLRFDHDYPKALAYLERALEKEPGSDRNLNLLSITHARLGHWKEALEVMKRAVELNPRDTGSFDLLGFCYSRIRQFQKASDAYDRARTLDPDNWVAVYATAQLHTRLGQLDAARALLARVPSQLSNKRLNNDFLNLRWRLAFLSRDYVSALSIAQAMPMSVDPRDAGDNELSIGRAELALGHPDKAMRDLEEARRKVELLISFRPPDGHQRLARIHAARGDRAAAIAEADKAIELLPLDKYPEEGLPALETKAEVHAQLGEANEAIALLQQLFATEGTGVLITEALLRLDPTWDLIRGDPRFQQLCQEKHP